MESRNRAEQKWGRAAPSAGLPWLVRGLFMVSVVLCFLGFTGALFRMHLGLQGLASGFIFGTAFG